jgi:hypothetical protein
MNSDEPEHSVQTAGFWIFGFLSVMLAVLKLTVAAYCSWWRVMLPLLAFLGHNLLYVLVGLLCFRWLKHNEEEDSTTVGSIPGTATTSRRFYFSSCFWTTCCDMSRDKTGSDSGRAREDSRW